MTGMGTNIEAGRPVRLAVLSFAHYHANFWSEAFGDDPRVEFVGIWDDDAERGRAAAARFGLTAADAKTILREVVAAVSDWRKTARQLRIKANTLAPYATAFEHPLMDEARHLL